jgi:cytochrome c-type biogenesis protein CcmE
MKKIHIILLVLVAGAIAVLLSFLKASSTFDTIETAMNKPGKYVHLMARLDKREPIEYDAIKNPNYLSFTAIDTTGRTVKVVYHDAKPDNLEMSSSIVMKGKYNNGLFECSSIQPKCPSKYKEEQARGEKHPDSIKIK